MGKQNCAFHKQIVWFFDKPTVIVCESCERTFYHDITICPECRDEVTYFTKEDGE